jgi:hypothetical protein
MEQLFNVLAVLPSEVPWTDWEIPWAGIAAVLAGTGSLLSGIAAYRTSRRNNEQKSKNGNTNS